MNDAKDMLRDKPYILAGDLGRVQHLHVAVVLGLSTAAVFVAGAESVLGAAAAWEPFLALAMMVFTGLGITVGYHRLFAHHAFKTGAIMKGLLAIAGSMAGQGPPIYWVGNHRRHHRFSDSDGDPHSPRWVGDAPATSRAAGWLHAHIGWLFSDRVTHTGLYCKDLYQDRIVVWVNRRYHLWVFLGLALPALVGAWMEPLAWGAAKGLLWGGGVRMFVSYHCTQSINSVCHLFGFRPFETREFSTNNFWLALPTLGEAWHNNHHVYASSAIFGLRWWEIDIGGLFIRLLERLGLATAVTRHDPAVLEKARAQGKLGESRL